MRVESAENYTIRGKTGWAWARSRRSAGMWAGSRRAMTWFFAINVDIRTPEDARFRKEALNAAMRETGLIE